MNEKLLERTPTTHNQLPVLGIDSLPLTFLSFLKNYPLSTQITYKAEVEKFLGFLRHLDPSLSRLDQLARNHLILYRDHLKQSGQASRSILKAMSAISSFCKFFAEAGHINKDLTYGIRRPKVTNKKETGDFTETQVKAIFESLNPKSFYFKAHRAILAVGFFTGLRESNIRRLKIGDLGQVRGHQVLKIIIKGDKPHEIPLNPFVVFCLEEHLERLKELGFDCALNAYLFPSLKTRRAGPICSSSLYRILKVRLAKAGIEESAFYRQSPHSMRATFCGTLLNVVGAPLEKVQRLMGHSKPDTTLGYDKRKKTHDGSPVYQIDFNLEYGQN